MDARSDVYGMGAVLYCMIAGHPPFQNSNATELLLAHAQIPPRPLCDLEGLTVPPEVNELVLRCLAKDPSDRFANAGDLARAIEGVRA